MKFDAAGGYRRLDSWIMASIVQLANYRFCDKYITRAIDPTGRQYDQMTQSARSGTVNIAEGSARSGTSKETEMKLTDVAYASLTELHNDYETWLLRREIVPWRKPSDEAQAVYAVRLDRPDYGQDVVHDSCAHILVQQKKFAPWLKNRDPVVIANAMLILIARTINMLLRQKEAQGENFLQTGGFRENLTAHRIDARAREENAPTCSACGKPMQRRKARAGKNAGHEFWGCTGYPDCRTTREIESTGSTGVDGNDGENPNHGNKQHKPDDSSAPHDPSDDP